MNLALLRAQILGNTAGLRRCYAPLHRAPLTHVSPPRSSPRGGAVRCAATSPVVYPPPAYADPIAQAPPQGPRFFADLSFYKGKSAISLKVVSPSFQGDSTSGYVTISKQGSLLVEFASVVEGSGSGPGERRYDWQKKQSFALSAVELAGIVEMTEQRYVHDPNLGNTSKGQIIKTLSFNKSQSSQDWFLGLQVRENNTEAARFSIPLTPNELATIRILARTLIPHFLGVDQVLNSHPLIGSKTSNGPNY